MPPLNGPGRRAARDPRERRGPARVGGRASWRAPWRASWRL